MMMKCIPIVVMNKQMKASVLTQRNHFILLRFHHTMDGTDSGDKDLGIDILLPVANEPCKNC